MGEPTWTQLTPPPQLLSFGLSLSLVCCQRRELGTVRPLSEGVFSHPQVTPILWSAFPVLQARLHFSAGKIKSIL